MADTDPDRNSGRGPETAVREARTTPRKPPSEEPVSRSPAMIQVGVMVEHELFKEDYETFLGLVNKSNVTGESVELVADLKKRIKYYIDDVARNKPRS